MANDELVAQLLRVELFQDLTKAQLSDIASHLERVTFRAGDLITKGGESADAALLIVAGAAQWVDTTDADLDLDSINEPIAVGSLVGEMAMVIEYIYGATIVASGPVKCLKITRAAMHDAMLRDPSLAENLTAKISQRLSRLASDLRTLDREFVDALPEFAKSAFVAGHIAGSMGATASAVLH